MAISLAGATLGAAGIGAASKFLGDAKALSANKQSAREQMAFQERMSSTAYQRAASDLEAAGLNRILALGSPASTPGGAGYTAPDFGGIGSVISQGISAGASTFSSAKQAEKTDSDIALAKKQGDKILKETETIEEKFKREVIKTRAWEVLSPLIGALDKSVEGWTALLKEMQRDGSLKDFLMVLNSPSDYIKREIANFFRGRYQELIKTEQGQWIMDALGTSISIIKGE